MSYCRDCSLNCIDLNEFYMVHDEIWNSAANPWDILCLYCLEHRLDRVLVPEDFKKERINTDLKKYPKSDRLLERMGLKVKVD